MSDFVDVPIVKSPSGEVNSIVGSLKLSRQEHDRIVETAFACMAAPTLHFSAIRGQNEMMQAWIDFGGTGGAASCFKKPEAAAQFVKKILDESMLSECAGAVMDDDIAYQIWNDLRADRARRASSTLTRTPDDDLYDALTKRFTARAMMVCVTEKEA